MPDALLQLRLGWLKKLHKIREGTARESFGPMESLATQQTSRNLDVYLNFIGPNDHHVIYTMLGPLRDI